MAVDKRITELPAATTPLAGTEKVEIVQGGLNKQVDASELGGGAGNFVPLTLTADTTIESGGFLLRLRGTGAQLAQFVLDAANNIRKGLIFKTGNVKRWEIHVENNETGSANIGSDFHIERFDDAGAYIDNPIIINRTDGVVDFNKTPTAPTAAPGTNTIELATTAFVTAAVAASTNVVDQVSTSVAGGTITLDMNSQKQRSHYGSASFATAKIIAMSNTTGSLFFNFFIEITSVSAVLTFPSDWISASPDFNGTTWTPPTTGKFEFGGSYNGLWTQWNIKVNGPSA